MLAITESWKLGFNEKSMLRNSVLQKIEFRKLDIQKIQSFKNSVIEENIYNYCL